MTHENEQAEKLRSGIKDLIAIWNTPEPPEMRYDAGVVYGLRKALFLADMYLLKAEPVTAGNDRDADDWDSDSGL